MENNILKCPSCSGQMTLAEAKPGDKIAKCEYCHTIVDLPDTANKQGFDLNEFFKGFNMDGIKNVNTTTTTTTTSTVIIKNGEVVNSNGNNEEILDSVKEILKKSGVHVDGLTDKTNENDSKS